MPMRFELPKFRSVCLGPAAKTWLVESSCEEESSNGKTGWNPHLRDEVICLNLREESDGLEVPVCHSSRRRAGIAARLRRFEPYIMWFGIGIGSLLAACSLV